MTLPRMRRRPAKEGAAIRSESHLRWIRQHECIVEGCHDWPTVSHHVRLGSHSGSSLKPGDDKAVSLCVGHHAEVHRGELTFQLAHKIDLQSKAAEFAAKSPPLQRRRQRR